ncbi:MAG: polysaccharide deacetylase family protein, partial [Tsuneonella sp.]
MPLDPLSPPGFLSEGVGQWAEARCARLAAGGELELHDLLTGQMSVRRSVFEALGGFDESFTRGGGFGNEDLDFGIRLLTHYKVVFDPHAITRQRYVVTPEVLLRRSRETGHADTRLAHKHHARAAEVFGANQARRRSVSLLARALAHAPLLAGWLSKLALAVAGRGTRADQRLFYLARQVQYHAGVREALDNRLLVLCYHAIADLSADPVLSDYGVEPEVLASQMDDLRTEGHTFVSADEVLAWLERGEPLPQRPVLLTFDDCYRDLLPAVRAVLAPRRVPAVAFAVSALVGGENEWDKRIGARALPLLDAAGLRALAAAGVEIGAHSRTHSQLAGLAPVDLEAETARAASDLAALGLPRPRFYAYPYGVHDARARAAVRNAGYAAAFALANGRARRQHRFTLARVEVLASDGIAGVRRKMRGAR